jgi:hypothetical protein
MSDAAQTSLVCPNSSNFMLSKDSTDLEIFIIFREEHPPALASLAPMAPDPSRSSNDTDDQAGQ